MFLAEIQDVRVSWLSATETTYVVTEMVELCLGNGEVRSYRETIRNAENKSRLSEEGCGKRKAAKKKL